MGWLTLSMVTCMHIFESVIAQGLHEEKSSNSNVLTLVCTGGEVPVIIFAHGFSQPVQNYISTLKELASKAETVVIAPETSLFQVLGAVAGASTDWLGDLMAKPPTKMQVQ